MADHKIVPVEPTVEMEIDGIQAVIDAGLDTDDGAGATEVRLIYRAMLSAAPSAADDKALVRRVRTALEPFCYDGAQAFELAITAIRAIEEKGHG